MLENVSHDTEPNLLVFLFAMFTSQCLILPSFFQLFALYTVSKSSHHLTVCNFVKS